MSMMGPAISRVKSVIVRAGKNFNVENRAHKFIEKQTTFHVASPKHESSRHHLDAFTKEHPELLTELRKKDDGLISRMMEMKIENVGDEYEDQKSARALPTNRETFDGHEYGFQTPAVIPSGKLSLPGALQMIINYQSDPLIHTSKSLAKEHNIDQAQVQLILKHFFPFDMYIPQSVRDEKPALKALQLDKTRITDVKGIASGMKTTSKSKEIDLKTKKDQDYFELEDVKLNVDTETVNKPPDVSTHGTTETVNEHPDVSTQRSTDKS